MNGNNMVDSTIKLSKATKERLEKHGKMGDTYEDVIKMLLDKVEKEKL